eukprot:3468548-Rhodomonas_salina.2
MSPGEKTDREDSGCGTNARAVETAGSLRKGLLNLCISAQNLFLVLSVVVPVLKNCLSTEQAAWV